MPATAGNHEGGHVVISTKLELVRALQAAGVRPNAYSISGSSNMALCLEEDANGWEVFYYERGSKFSPKRFQTEAEACTDMFHELLSDQAAFI